MSRSIDGQFSVSQIPNVQQLSTAAAREAELAEQRQRIAARRAEEAEQARVGKEQAVEGKTIRDEDPREERKPRNKPQLPPRPAPDEPAADSIDITL
jgi:hypothetical protein